MEGLSGILGTLANFGGQNWQKLLTGGLFGAGEVGNLLEERKRAAYQNYVMNLINKPGALARLALSNEKPLDNALVQGVTNQVQGQLAERGLSQAPGIFASTESQALAPYEQQNQQVAMSAILQALGLPAQTFGKPQDMSGALRLFLNSMQPKAGGEDIFANLGDAPWVSTGGSNNPTAINPFPTGVVPTFDPSSIGQGGMP